MVPMSTKKRNYVKWGKLGNLRKLKYEIVLMNDQNIMFGYTPLLNQLKNEKCESVKIDEF